MKKMICICMAALMALSALTGCSTGGNTGAQNPADPPSAKVVVNIEGTVTAVNGEEVTLDSGKVVLISSDTVFAGDPDTNNAVSQEIAVGNFIQGYTQDDPDADRVSAHKIWTNTAPRTGGKIVINFEGTVAAVEGDRVTLESGQVVLISSDTVFSVATGVVEQVTLSEGHTIQGYTEDDPAASEITAARVHIITY